MKSVVSSERFSVGPARGDEFGVRLPPRVGVARSVELGNHSNPAKTRVLDHLHSGGGGVEKEEEKEEEEENKRRETNK